MILFLPLSVVSGFVDRSHGGVYLSLGRSSSHGTVHGLDLRFGNKRMFFDFLLHNGTCNEETGKDSSDQTKDEKENEKDGIDLE